MNGWFVALIAVCCGACASARQELKTPSKPPARSASGAAPPGAPPVEALAQPAWAKVTTSPRWTQVEPRLRELVGTCPTERALVQTAEAVAKLRLETGSVPEVSVVTDELRRRGSPYVWPRVWTLVGVDLSAEDARGRVAQWMRTFDDGGQRRCGMAWVRSERGDEAIVVVAVDALGDMLPFGTTARSGQWLDVEAELFVPVTKAELVLLGPRGLPRRVTASLSEGHMRGRFALDQPGHWIVQVLPTTSSGPRPALEAELFVDTKPTAHSGTLAVPGESIEIDGARDADPRAFAERATLQMLNAARDSEGLAPLRLDERLQDVARAHASKMADVGRVGHDLGDGGPMQRLQDRGLVSRINGENLVHATNSVRAHRALWASPAHRGNMLDARYQRVGVGAAVGADGTVWICQLFAG